MIDLQNSYKIKNAGGKSRRIGRIRRDGLDKTTRIDPSTNFLKRNQYFLKNLKRSLW